MGDRYSLGMGGDDHHNCNGNRPSNHDYLKVNRVGGPLLRAVLEALHVRDVLRVETRRLFAALASKKECPAPNVAPFQQQQQRESGGAATTSTSTTAGKCSLSYLLSLSDPAVTRAVGELVAIVTHLSQWIERSAPPTEATAPLAPGSASSAASRSWLQQLLRELGVLDVAFCAVMGLFGDGLDAQETR